MTGRGMINDPGGTAMTHTIKLTDEVYDELCQVLEPRETFSEAVGRMIGDHKRWQGEHRPKERA